MDIDTRKTHAKFLFDLLMLTLIFGIRDPFGPGERLKRPGLIGLNKQCLQLSGRSLSSGHENRASQ